MDNENWCSFRVKLPKGWPYFGYTAEERAENIKSANEALQRRLEERERVALETIFGLTDKPT